MVVGNVPEAGDFVVVGAGPGGYEAALNAAAAGRRVMLIDRDGKAGVGGVCLRVGCIPSKALIESADLNYRARHSAAMGVPPTTGSFSMDAFQTWKAEVIGGLTQAVSGLLRRAGVELVAGIVALTEPNVLVIDTPDDQARFVQFKSLVLATGSTPSALPALPFDGERILDSTALLELTSLPQSLAVVGGGYVGLELGTAMAKLGVAVTVIEAETRLLPAMAEALAAPVQRRLRQLGVTVMTGAWAAGYTATTLQVDTAGGTQVAVSAEKILVAVGRRANTAQLGLEVLNPSFTDDLVLVGEDRRISANVAAIGDITPGPALAHKASAEAAVAVAALCGETVAFEPAAIPVIVFSDPEIASTGLSLTQANDAGLDAKATRLPLAASGRAATLGHREGFTEIIHDRDGGRIIGVHIASPHASELIAEAVLAIEMGVTLEDLALVIHPHPTLSEQLAQAARRHHPST